MPAWADLQSYGPADKTLNAEGVEAIRQQLVRPQPLSSLWIPVETVVIVDVFGATVAVSQTTIDLSTKGIVVPANTAAVQYRVIVAVISGASTSATVNIFHKPGGSSVLPVTAIVSGGDATGSVIADINGGRLTYSATMGGSPTYAYHISVTGFLRAGALL